MVPTELPIDVVEEILVQLPAENVMRLKFLSKTYYNLITNPKFINKHLHHRSRNTSVVIGVSTDYFNSGDINFLEFLQPDSSSEIIKPPSDIKPTHNIAELVGSCHGLLCLRLDGRSRCHTIWNPSTGEYLRIPSSKLVRPSSDILGFGYDARCGGDYKLVKIRYYSASHAEVWSMRKNKWKAIGVVLPDILIKEHSFHDHNGLFIKGSLYWLAYPERGTNPTLVSFNLNDDTFQVVALPDDLFVRRILYKLTINDYMGSLALFIPFYFSCAEIRYDVWVMEEDCCSNSLFSWTKKFTIGPLPRSVQPTGASINGKFIMRSMGGCKETAALQLYDPHCHKEKQDTKFRFTYGDALYKGNPWSFTDSLVSIKQLHRK